MVCTWRAYGMETQMSECEDIFALEVLQKHILKELAAAKVLCTWFLL